MKLRRSTFALAVFPLLACIGILACATQVAPSGGPEDKLPPRIAAVYPAPKTTNHPEELYVKLEFDEWINGSVPRGAVSISPPIDGKMKFKVSGRTLEMYSKALLDTGTTYTVTFAGGIKDLHGNALAKPFQVVFSTGAHIDSLKLSGRIMVNADREGRRYLEKYRDSVTKQLDSLPMLTKEPPLFVTRADSAGNFTLTGLKPGRYRVVAFADENGNQKIEPASELAGVWTSDLVLTEESSDTLWVPLADHDTSALELESVTQPYARVLEANFSRPVFFDSAFADTANCTLTYPDGSVVHPHYVYMGATSKKPQFYFDSIPKPELTDAALQIPYLDTAKDSLSRALDPKHAEVEWSWVEKPSDTLPPAISSTQLRSMAKSVFPGDTLVVSFNKPVDSLESSFHIVLNKDTTAIEMKRIDPIRFMAVPASPWPTDAAIEFLQGYKDTTLAKADSNGVRDTVVELKYKRLLRFETVPKIKLASLKGTLKRANPGVTVRLVSLDTKRPYFTQCDVNGAFVFDNLMEGKYFIDYYYAESGRNTPDGGSLSPFRFGKPWRAPNDTVRVSNGENDIEKLLPDMPALP